MPELPEVETTLRGITPHLLGHKIHKVAIRHHGLRWPIPSHLDNTLKNKTITHVYRRAKYLLFTTATGTLIIHLGMSGSLRILTQSIPAGKHDHFDMELAGNKTLRFTDPRRFGAILWAEDNPLSHALLKNLGPEPLEAVFNADYIWSQAQGKKTAIKTFLMNNKIVVGVGNIYAAESLFAAGIHPQTPVGKISLARYKKLVTAVKNILRKAIQHGGTTLKDFVDSSGKPGYFRLQLQVYGRGKLPCLRCKTTLTAMRQGQRTTVFCKQCQKK